MSAPRPIAVVALLLCLAGIVQIVVIGRAVVPAIDAVRFVGVAQAIERQGLAPAVRQQREEPLFAASVWATHALLRHVADDAPGLWATAAQAAAAVALALSVVPVYFIALRLAGPGAAAVGGALCCVLPELCRLGAEGISDSTHLLWFALAFWLLVEWWRRPALPSGASLGIMTAAGAATAVAMLARAEAIVLPATVMLAALLVQRRRDWRRPWKPLVFALSGYALGVALVLGPFVISMGATTPTAALARVLGRAELPNAPAVAPVWRFDDGRPMAFPVREPGGRDLRRRGAVRAVVRYAECLAQAFGYVAGLLALVGAWRLRRQRPDEPIDRLVQVFFAAFSAATLVHAATEGYLSPRHLAPLVAVTIGCAGLGAVALGEAIGSRIVRRPVWIVAAMVVLLSAGYLVVALRPLHAGRLAWREAGVWLATQTETPGAVLDTLGWSALYSGRQTYQYDQAQAAMSDPHLAFVVVGRWEVDSPSERGRTLRYWLSAAAEPVERFSGPTAAARSTAIVYRWDGEAFRRALCQR